VSVLILFALFFLVAAAVAFFQFQQRQARMRAVMALVTRIGFTFARDGYDIPEMPFAFFRQGHSRKAQFVVSGRHDELPLEMFDYQYTTGNGRSSQVHRCTCAILTIPAACPELALSHENALTRLEDHLVHHDVELEYDDFNRRFRVSCEQQQFAFAVLDGEMMQWLLSADGFEHLEIMGPWVLLVSRSVPPVSWVNLGNWLDAFHAHIPPIVYSTYPRQ